jgi:photosystem II stability/assembly factor-like uncharacterized protein
MSLRGAVWHVALAVGLVTLLITAFQEPGVTRQASGDAPERSPARDGFDAPAAAAAFAEARRTPAARGVNPAALYDRAAALVQRMPRFSSRIARLLPDSQPAARLWLSGTSVVDGNGRVNPQGVLDAWTPLGPGNIGGRTRIVRFHPTNHDRLFAAGVSGGIWRSDDAGGSWRPIAEGLVNIAINSLAIDPRRPDVMFAGTGEGYFREEIRGTGLPLRGGGIFVTEDGGQRWRRLSSTETSDFHWVNDIELGVADSRRLYAATRTGVWRSNDEGRTWSRMLAVSVRGGCMDLALRPDRDEDVLLASCGSYDQATVYRFSRAATDTNVEVVLQEPDMGRTSLAIAPSNPEVIYALAASNAPGPNGNYRQALLAVYRSDRGGAAGTWQTRVSNTDPLKLNTLLLTNPGGATVEECGAPAGRNSFTNMGWYINVIAVDPRDENRVWAAGVDWFRSDDGGRNWGIANATSGASGMHVDQHAIAFHPSYDGTTNQMVLVGNDGGIYRTNNARARVSTSPRVACDRTALQIAWQSLNRGYGVTQFYHGLPFPNGDRYIGGAQDNSTPFGSDADGIDGWRSVFGGDGGYVAVDPRNTQVMYVESQWANIAKTTDGAVRFTSAVTGLDPVRSDVLGPEANYLFVSPFVMDPANSQRLWLGGEFIYRTNNAAASWSKASTLLPDSGLVSAIAVAASDSNRVVVGSHKGDVLWTRRAADASPSTEWERSRPRDGWVTAVACDARNPDVLFATYGNFGGAHVFRSADGGLTWRALDGDGDGRLPDIPVHSVVVDPDDSARLYLGTDLGVFVSIDGGQRWFVEETGFGPAVTEWLALTRDASGRKWLFAFTHGRGAWRVDLR